MTQGSFENSNACFLASRFWVLGLRDSGWPRWRHSSAASSMHALSTHLNLHLTNRAVATLQNMLDPARCSMRSSHTSHAITCQPRLWTPRTDWIIRKKTESSQSTPAGTVLPWFTARPTTTHSLSHRLTNPYPSNSHHSAPTPSAPPKKPTRSPQTLPAIPTHASHFPATPHSSGPRRGSGSPRRTVGR